MSVKHKQRQNCWKNGGNSGAGFMVFVTDSLKCGCGMSSMCDWSFCILMQVDSQIVISFKLIYNVSICLTRPFRLIFCRVSNFQHPSTIQNFCHFSSNIKEKIFSPSVSQYSLVYAPSTIELTQHLNFRIDSHPFGKQVPDSLAISIYIKSPCQFLFLYTHVRKHCGILDTSFSKTSNDFE